MYIIIFYILILSARSFLIVEIALAQINMKVILFFDEFVSM